MITRPIPFLPVAPADPEQASDIFDMQVQRCVSAYLEAVNHRLAWFRTLMEVDVTDIPSRLQYRVLSNPVGGAGLTAWPWRFNISGDGNRWWPNPTSAVIAAQEETLCVPYVPMVAGVPFNELGPEATVALAGGARTFWLRCAISDLPSSAYQVEDSLWPARPDAIEVINLALGDLPDETPTKIWVPWCDVPPADPPQPRVPTYHFALWFRLSHYHPPEASASSSSSSSSSPSSGSPPTKTIVP